MFVVFDSTNTILMCLQVRLSCLAIRRACTVSCTGNDLLMTPAMTGGRCESGFRLFSSNERRTAEKTIWTGSAWLGRLFLISVPLLSMSTGSDLIQFLVADGWSTSLKQCAVTGCFLSKDPPAPPPPPQISGHWLSGTASGAGKAWASVGKGKQMPKIFQFCFTANSPDPVPS